MKKMYLLLGLMTAVTVPSIGSAKLILDIPPLVVQKTDCTPYGCTQCYPGCPDPCVKCDPQCIAYPSCIAGPCYPTCADPCKPCTPTPTGGLNDTGITAKVGNTGQEDADYGRDKTVQDTVPSDGHAGFSFTKLDSNGTALAASATSWACVKDNVTGLMWEIQANPSERPWFNSDNSKNGGNAGNENGGANTESYAALANTNKLCGASSGWRLPTIKELLGIVKSSSTTLAVDQNYFSGMTANKFFWSATPYAADPASAWAVKFTTGSTFGLYYKTETSTISVILVRTAN
ncbi:MAG: Protein of unknown function (DUF1566) [Candidatus Electronema aureum]|uniref:4Fe-4S ferredoxin-type domain-containing protein n=1 Tax=Candidatus Electronema aureum TaxID=2005002 RepID=A0A521FYR2_9BACT|nr:MAG: Protein of unknown function (DUF1566) [Candidatus Electronema aureum]